MISYILYRVSSLYLFFIFNQGRQGYGGVRSQELEFTGAGG